MKSETRCGLGLITRTTKNMCGQSQFRQCDLPIDLVRNLVEILRNSHMTRYDTPRCAHVLHVSYGFVHILVVLAFFPERCFHLENFSS